MRTIDVDFACWFCAQPFDRAWVEADAQLMPRRREDGGPYFLGSCPSCGQPSRIERNRAGAFLAGPTPVVPFADRLMAAADGEAREELRRKREHFARRPGRREWFFKAYAEELWAAGVRPGTAGSAARPRSSRPPPPPPPPPTPPPEPEPEPPPEATPHEVLGLEPDATAEQAAKAFRELAKRYHPDRFEALDEEFRALAHKKFLQLKAALDSFA